MRNRHNMKNIISLFIILICIFTATSCQESLEERCARELKEHTAKNCPARIDANTFQDSVVYESSTRTIHYYYTISGLENIPNTATKIRQILLYELKNTTSMRAYKNDGFNFRYTYRSASTGNIITSEFFTKEDYN